MVRFPIKGQVTLFVLLALFILTLIGTYLYVRSETTENKLLTALKDAITPDEPPKIIARHVGSTVKAGLLQSKNLLNPAAPLFIPTLTQRTPLSPPLQEPPRCKPGGEAKSTETPEEPETFDDFPHTYLGDQYVYYFNIVGAENIPTPQQLSRMIEQKIKNDLPYILNQVPPDLLQNYAILTDLIHVQVLLTPDRLKTRITLPICTSDQPAQTETVQTTLKTNLLPLLDFARWIVEQDIEHPEYLDLSGLDEEAERRNFKISLIEEEGARIYTLVDMDPDVEQTFTTLSFASLLET